MTEPLPQWLGNLKDSDTILVAEKLLSEDKATSQGEFHHFLPEITAPLRVKRLGLKPHQVDDISRFQKNLRACGKIAMPDRPLIKNDFCFLQMPAVYDLDL